MNRRENPDTGSGKSSAGSPARKRILFWAKVAVSALVLFLVLRSADLSRTFGFIASSRKGLWLTALALLLLSQAVSTFRWHTLLQPLDFNLPWPRVFRIYFVGMFFSLFLPT
ncbi:MAG: flippase-like domain-containing protein, partial [bacterium]